MLTFPAEATTLEAHAIVATITLEFPDTLCASTAKVSIVLMKSTLHHFVFVRLQGVELLQKVVPSVDRAYHFDF